MYMDVHFVPCLRLIFTRVSYLLPLFTPTDISEPPRMAVVLVCSVFALQTRRYEMYMDVHFVPCLRVFFARS